jgi:hypothetical protein
LQDGGDDGWLQRIVNAFHSDPDELEKALVETEAIHQREPNDAMREIEERERRLRPFIWIVTEDGAHSFLTAMAGRPLKVLRLPEGSKICPSQPDWRRSSAGFGSTTRKRAAGIRASAKSSSIATLPISTTLSSWTLTAG